jgi:hypothetical protein
VAAATKLARLRERENGATGRGDALEQLKSVVETFCPGAWATWSEPSDPTRDLDLRVRLSPLAWRWLPFAPSELERAEAAGTGAAKRLGLGEGP